RAALEGQALGEARNWSIRARYGHVRQMSKPRSVPGGRLTLARGSLIGSMIAIAVVVVLGVLEAFGVGLGDQDRLPTAYPNRSSTWLWLMRRGT
ncbi:MAG TPA: hypothetical protein VFV13_08710, partial [Acidimicrobiia bacterium]|nr:hypothetical protein [Acidimicrobiia bacterium]